MDPRAPSATHRQDAAPPAEGLEVRPGVPMEAEPEPAEGAHWAAPEPQPGIKSRLERAGFPRSTPVAGALLAERAASATLRRRAYAIPEHDPKRWILLMAADRVDVAEDRIGSFLARPFELVGIEAGARGVRRNPLPFAAGAALGLWLALRALR